MTWTVFQGKKVSFAHLIEEMCPEYNSWWTNTYLVQPEPKVKVSLSTTDRNKNLVYEPEPRKITNWYIYLNKRQSWTGDIRLQLTQFLATTERERLGICQRARSHLQICCREIWPVIPATQLVNQTFWFKRGVSYNQVHQMEYIYQPRCKGQCGR